MSSNSESADTLMMAARAPSELVSAHIVERLAPGGIETLVLDLIGAAPGRNLVFSLQGSTGELIRDWPLLETLGDRIEGLQRRAGVDASVILRLARRLWKTRPNAVFLHHTGPLLYGGAASMLARIPSVVHVEHDAWHFDDPREQTIVRWCTRLFQPQLVAVSEQVAARLAAVAPHRPITVIPPGVATDRFIPGDKIVARQRLNLDPRSTVIGTVGRLAAVKGHQFLLSALALLPDNVHVVIVGEGNERANLTRQMRDLALTDRLHLVGHRDDLPSIYPAFDVFCLPSLHEGLPRSLLEAQACGVPAVAAHVGGVAEGVCPRSSLLVPPEDAEAIAAAIQLVLHRTDAVSPRDFIERHFSLATALCKYAQLLEKRP